MDAKQTSTGGDSAVSQHQSSKLSQYCGEDDLSFFLMVDGRETVVAYVKTPLQVEYPFTGATSRDTIFPRTAILAPGGWASD